jgi:hypothetical protein
VVDLIPREWATSFPYMKSTGFCVRQTVDLVVKVQSAPGYQGSAAVNRQACHHQHRFTRYYPQVPRSGSTPLPPHRWGLRVHPPALDPTIPYHQEANFVIPRPKHPQKQVRQTWLDAVSCLETVRTNVHHMLPRHSPTCCPRPGSQPVRRPWAANPRVVRNVASEMRSTMRSLLHRGPACG